MQLRLVALAGLFSLSVVRMAHAEDVNPGPLSFDPEVQFGWVQGKHSGGIDAGLALRVRYAFLTAGLSAQGAAHLVGSTASVSAVGGVSIPVAFIRFDALGEVGLNAYSSVGAGLLNDDPGASATLPFAGGRASVQARIFQSRRGASIWLGPAVQYARDLYTTTRTYTYNDQGPDWFGGDDDNDLQTSTVRIGQSRLAVLLSVSAQLPL